MPRDTADRGVNTAHSTSTAHGAGGGPVRPVHGAFQHSMLRRCFNHDYRDPFFYMITITTHQRRPWFGICENNACTLSADGLLVRDLWYRIPHDYPPFLSHLIPFCGHRLRWRDAPHPRNLPRAERRQRTHRGSRHYGSNR